jgi:hypothetical protein
VTNCCTVEYQNKAAKLIETVSEKRLTGPSCIILVFTPLFLQVVSSLHVLRSKCCVCFLPPPYAQNLLTSAFVSDLITLIAGYLMTSTRYEALNCVVFSIYPFFLSRVSKYSCASQELFKEKTKNVLHCSRPFDILSYTSKLSCLNLSQWRMFTIEVLNRVISAVSDFHSR